MKIPAFGVASPEYRSIGLLANPFRGPLYNDALDDAGNAVTHAEAVRFMKALDVEAAADRSRPIWITKGEQIPDYYSRVSLGEILAAVPSSSEMNVLLAYVPFFMMRHGRIRSALSMVAERVAGESFGRTLGMYAAAAFAEPDVELLASAGLDSDAAARLAERFAQDPEGVAEEFFGVEESTRETGPALDEVVKSAAVRKFDLDMDPETNEEESDVVLEEPGVDLAVDDASEEPAPAERTYLIDHSRRHISPVMARALKKYVDEGVYAVAEELKITKGPRKVLAALAKFATYRFRKIVIVYDQFDSWNNAPESLRIKIAGSLAEIRMLLGTSGVIVVMAADQQLEEIHDQFMGANEVEWTMAPMLEEIDDTGLQPGLIEFLLESAQISADAGLDELRASLATVLDSADSNQVDLLGDLVDELASAN